MQRFLIDANLPRRLTLWAVENFQYVADIDPTLSDRSVWDYAKIHNLTIVTKDADFTDRALVRPGEVRVIHFRTGNMPFKAFEKFVEQNWSSIIKLSATHQIVTVYEDCIDCFE